MIEITKARINTIKNIKLIYFYPIDNFLGNESNKYIGAKIVYGNAETISIDYKDKYFGYFIKKIREVYNQEKKEGNIVLLGSLAKIILDFKTAITTENNTSKKSERQIPLFEVVNKKEEKYLDVLKEVMKFIISLYIDSENITIDEVKGYNNRYLLTYTSENMTETIPLIIYNSNNGICFRTNRIANTNYLVQGKIYEEAAEIIASFENEKIRGNIRFIPNQNKIIKEASDINGIIYYDESEQEINTEILDSCFNILNLPKPETGLKIGNTYILCQKETIEGTEEFLYSYVLYIVNLNHDMIITKIAKSEINKYQGSIIASLEETMEEYSLTRISVEDNDYILIQRKTLEDNKPSYYYMALEVEDGISFDNPLEVISSFDLVNIESQEDIKKKILERRKDNGGNE